VKRTRGSHRVLSHADHADFVFAFHDRVEIGPRMLARIARRTGLTPDDL
jgi:predicted RNA binding protein YcfA (HicA-like mRNA interferase family)